LTIATYCNCVFTIVAGNSPQVQLISLLNKTGIFPVLIDILGSNILGRAEKVFTFLSCILVDTAHSAKAYIGRGSLGGQEVGKSCRLYLL